MSSEKDRQSELFDRFKQHSCLSDDYIKLSRDCIIASEHDKQRNALEVFLTDDDPRFAIGVKRFKPDGSEFTLGDVPLNSLVDAIEDLIQTCVAEPHRTEVYKKVVDGVHGTKQTPKWDRVDSPRTKPQTLYSQSRASPKLYRTNQQLFRKFKAVSMLSPETVDSIQAMIVWRDSERSNGTWGAINLHTFEVTGGRLGPTEEHTLSDVPHCFVRDRLMASTFIDINPERRDLVRKALFPDLTFSEIEEYAAVIEKMERQAEVHRPAGAKKARQSREVSDRALLVRKIQYERKISPQEAECIMKQEELLDAIDDTINLAPNLSFAARRMKCPQQRRLLLGKHSVLKPNVYLKMDEEVWVPMDCDIDRDCDQIRAMIKTFVRAGHWTMEQFTRALDGPRRPEVSKFLEKRGPLQGKQSSVFARSWDFFKRRELLGLELTAPPPKPKLS